MNSLPDGYVPAIGDIVTFDNRRSGVRSKCVIAQIVTPTFYMNNPKSIGEHFILEFDLPVRISRLVKNKIVTVWEPQLM